MSEREPVISAPADSLSCFSRMLSRVREFFLFYIHLHKPELIYIRTLIGIGSDLRLGCD